MESEEEILEEEYSSEDNESDAVFMEPPPRIQELPCVLCEKIEENQQSILKHLLESHSLVIGEHHKIADLQRYLLAWRSKFSMCNENPVQFYCTTISTPNSSGQSAVHYLLSDIIAEDKQLRKELQQDRLVRYIPVITFCRK